MISLENDVLLAEIGQEIHFAFPLFLGCTWSAEKMIATSFSVLHVHCILNVLNRINLFWG